MILVPRLGHILIGVLRGRARGRAFRCFWSDRLLDRLKAALSRAFAAVALIVLVGACRTVPTAPTPAETFPLGPDLIETILPKNAYTTGFWNIRELPELTTILTSNLLPTDEGKGSPDLSRFMTGTDVEKGQPAEKIDNGTSVFLFAETTEATHLVLISDLPVAKIKLYLFFSPDWRRTRNKSKQTWYPHAKWYTYKNGPSGTSQENADTAQTSAPGLEIAVLPDSHKPVTMAGMEFLLIRMAKSAGSVRAAAAGPYPALDVFFNPHASAAEVYQVNYSFPFGFLAEDTGIFDVKPAPRQEKDQGDVPGQSKNPQEGAVEANLRVHVSLESPAAFLINNQKKSQITAVTDGTQAEEQIAGPSPLFERFVPRDLAGRFPGDSGSQADGRDPGPLFNSICVSISYAENSAAPSGRVMYNFTAYIDCRDEQISRVFTVAGRLLLYKFVRDIMEPGRDADGEQTLVPSPKERLAEFTLEREGAMIVLSGIHLTLNEIENYLTTGGEND